MAQAQCRPVTPSQLCQGIKVSPGGGSLVTWSRPQHADITGEISPTLAPPQYDLSMTTQVPLLTLVLLLTPSLSSPLLPVPEFAKMMQLVSTTTGNVVTGQQVTGINGANTSFGNYNNSENSVKNVTQGLEVLGLPWPRCWAWVRMVAPP